jgi:hypothetical protein
MSELSIDRICPVSGGPITITNGLNVKENLNIINNYSFDSASINVGGVSTFYAGITSDIITCGNRPTEPEDLVNKSYIDELLQHRLVRIVSVDGAVSTATPSITLTPGTYKIYGEINGILNGTVGGTTSVTASLSWPSTSSLITATGSSYSFTHSTFGNTETILIPVLTANFTVSTTTSGTITRNVTSSLAGRTITVQNSLFYIFKG